MLAQPPLLSPTDASFTAAPASQSRLAGWAASASLGTCILVDPDSLWKRLLNLTLRIFKIIHLPGKGWGIKTKQ